MSERWVDLAWPDRQGRLRFVGVAEADLTDALSRITVDPAGIGWPGLPGPLSLLPDEASSPSPWDPNRQIRLCRLLGPDDEFSPACSRSVLDRAIAKVEGIGCRVVSAAELELFLLDPIDGSTVYSTIENYGIAAGAPYEDVMREVRGLRAHGVPVMATNPEYGRGQFEINLHHGPALASADHVSLLRTFTGVMAAREGYAATFCAKPGPSESGSGMHVHQSLWNDDGNVFWSGEGLSPFGLNYLAGLLDGIGELAPLGSPTPLSYTRRTDGSFCPTKACWGGDNRTVAIRVLAEDEATTRIEQRDASADANPHLILAGQLHAGLRGIEKGLEPPEATIGNAYIQNDLPPLPRTLPDALDLFAVSDLAKEVLGGEAHRVYCDLLQVDVDHVLAGDPGKPDPDGAW